MIRFTRVAVALIAAHAALPAEYEVKMFRIDLPLSGEMYDAITAYLAEPPDASTFDPECVPEGLRLVAMTPPNQWDGSDLLGRPGVLGGENAIPVAQGGQLYVGQDIPFEYLEPRSDGRFDRKIGYAQQGIEFSFRQAGYGQTRIWAHATRPGTRQPIDGVSLDVGPPRQDDKTIWTNFIVHSSLDQWCCTIFTLKEKPESAPQVVLLFLRNLTDEPSAEPATVTPPGTPIQFSIENKFIRVPASANLDEWIKFDENAEPISGNGRRVSAIRLPDSDEWIPVAQFDPEAFDTLNSMNELELLSAPRVTTLAGLTDADDTSKTLFKVVLPNQGGSSNSGRGGFGGGFGGGGLGDGGTSDPSSLDTNPAPYRDEISDVFEMFTDRTTLIGQFMASKGPGKPAIIADFTTDELRYVDSNGVEKDEAEPVWSGIMVGARVACTSAGEDIVLDIALIERDLEWPPAIKMTRKASSARPTPIEFFVSDESQLPRLIERNCWYRQPVKNGETTAFVLHDGARDDQTLVFVTVERVEGGAAFFPAS
ncbi:MAG: hypothetical protein AMXMBFR82_14290 [Candidatus Hydrogenedentota bacterium]